MIDAPNRRHVPTVCMTGSPRPASKNRDHRVNLTTKSAARYRDMDRVLVTDGDGPIIDF